MSPDLIVLLSALTRSAALWGDQAEVLRRAAVALDDGEAGALGARVAPLAGVSLAAWSHRLLVLAEAADGHADALLASGQLLTGTDDGVAGALGGAA